MPNSKAGLHLVLLTLLTATTISASDRQCVSVEIPEFNLAPDNSCSVSKAELTRYALPDQVFLFDLGVPADASCFNIVEPITGRKVIEGSILDPQTGKMLDITFSGVAGLTLNAYPETDPTDALSFTAATLVSMTIDGEELGTLVSRDAGTVFTDGNVAARLSVVLGTKKFEKIAGYIDEIGQEFNPVDPARASGVLCGKHLADSLFDDSEHSNDDDDD